MNMTVNSLRPAGLMAIDREMARQHGDALASFENAGETAKVIANSLKRTGRLLLLGMGGSHAVGRAMEPFYRELGVDAVALPLSEQLNQSLPLAGRTILMTSQSGESAEVLRFLSEAGISEGSKPEDVFGLTLEAGSTMARILPNLVGAGGTEHAFAATRSLTVTFALHAAILAALGEDQQPALTLLAHPQVPDLSTALDAMRDVSTIVTSGRRMQGVAEAIALGLTELSRLPCYSLEGGQLRHGPMEMLGPKVGIVLFRAKEATSELVARMARDAAQAGSPVVVFDASGEPPVDGIVSVPVTASSGMAAIFALLPAAQCFMVEFAASRVADAGTPVRSSKITRSE
ncbi:aminotransferase [Paramesorhizobium deserti]|uniref:Glutamine--fructose-6-phosphate aminotransferase [isomerizing] n=1 Tax=Paramesorhizobium deserti TaxID=1494590 RepID=A0A135HQ65_9HYPH|nr:aminotransferase [Paramesorhizobium deserti]KXF75341.1 aminotransferase [Paramesorhizobium deserti]